MNVAPVKLVATWRSGTLLAGSLVLMGVASVVTHLAGPAEAEGVSEASEHATAILPPLVGPLLALGLVGLARLGRRQALGPIWFLILPPLAFVLQELGERGLGSHMVEPGLLATALVQPPFALLAYALARLLRAAAIRVARFLRSPRRAPRPRVATVAWPRLTLSVALAPAVAGAHRGRAPPNLC